MTTRIEITHGSLAPNDQGLRVLVVSYALVFTSALFVIGRAIARYRVSRALEATDFLLPLALILAFAQTACTHFAVTYGMGMHVDEISPDNFRMYQKVIYTGMILYLLVLGISKASIALLIKNVEPQKPVLVCCYLALAIVCVWTVSSVTGVALQCSLPDPWNIRSGRCMNLTAFYNALAAINVLTDLAVVLIPICLMCLLPMQKEKKIWISLLFSTRLIVPVFTGVQIFYLQPVLVSHDGTYTAVTLQVWTQVVLNTSLITACIPSLGKVAIDVFNELTPRRPSQVDVEMVLSPLQKKESQVSVQEIEEDISPKPTLLLKLEKVLSRPSQSSPQPIATEKACVETVNIGIQKDTWENDRGSRLSYIINFLSARVTPRLASPASWRSDSTKRCANWPTASDLGSQLLEHRHESRQSNRLPGHSTADGSAWPRWH